MSGQRLVCPECGTTLRLKREFGAREKIDCPKCDATFQARDAEGFRAASDTEARRSPRASGAETRRSERAPATSRKAPRSRPDEDEDEDDEDDRPRKKKKKAEAEGGNGVLIAGMAGAGLVLVVAVGLIVWLLVGRGGTSGKDQVASANPPPNNQPVAPGGPAVPGGPTLIDNPGPNPNPLTNPTANPPANPNPLPRIDLPPVAGPSTSSGPMDPATLEKVKRATVYVKVTRADGLASGSGFLEAGSKMVMTNAHVVGMLSPSSPPPKKIELIFNSGLPDEKNYAGSVLGVDRISDLAILRIANLPAGQALPEPLQVVTAKGLSELQKVYVFGFPHGEDLGKNITASESSVSSLRRDPAGEIERVQVNGGMQPGNSGGPVVDNKGNVVGVAVAIITGTNLNFAIPGEAVRALLKGRLSDVVLGDSFRKGTQVVVPIRVSVINPLAQIRSVEVEWWVGAARKTTEAAPAGRPANPQIVKASYSPGAAEATAEVLLSAAPLAGQELFIRALCSSSGTDRSALPITSRAVDDPPEPKATRMVVRFQQRTRQVSLDTTLKMKIDANDTKVANYLINMNGILTEVVQPNGFGASLSYGVKHFEMGAWVNDKARPASDRTGKAFKVGFPNLVMGMQVDGQNNIVRNVVDVRRIQTADARDIIQSIGDQLTQALQLVTISTPGNGTLQPGQTWTGTRKVTLDELDFIEMLDSQNGILDITYTYRGIRKIAGRELPVISMRGRLRGEKGRSINFGGALVGEVALDPESGASLSGKASLQLITELKIPNRGTLQTTGTLDIKIKR